MRKHLALAITSRAVPFALSVLGPRPIGKFDTIDLRLRNGVGHRVDDRRGFVRVESPALGVQDAGVLVRITAKEPLVARENDSIGLLRVRSDRIVVRSGSEVLDTNDAVDIVSDRRQSISRRSPCSSTRSR
jgi:hypothetical protein